MKIKHLLFLTVLVCLLSCNSKSDIKAKFIVINNSGADIDSLIILPNDSNYSKIIKGDSIVYYSNMTNMAKVDGSYALMFIPKSEARIKTYHFGYFTNGYPLEDYTRIIVLPDTIQIFPHLAKSY